MPKYRKPLTSAHSNGLIDLVHALTNLEKQMDIHNPKLKFPIKWITITKDNLPLLIRNWNPHTTKANLLIGLDWLNQNISDYQWVKIQGDTKFIQVIRPTKQSATHLQIKYQIKDIQTLKQTIIQVLTNHYHLESR